MAQILRKKDTITVDDMKKEAEREARTMWQFVRTFLKWLVIAGVTGGIGGLVGSAFHLSVNWAAAFRAAHPWLLWLLPIGGLLIAAIYRLTKMENKNTNAIIDAIHFGDKGPLLLVPAIYLSTVITHLFVAAAAACRAPVALARTVDAHADALPVVCDGQHIIRQIAERPAGELARVRAEHGRRNAGALHARGRDDRQRHGQRALAEPGQIVDGGNALERR